MKKKILTTIIFAVIVVGIFVYFYSVDKKSPSANQGGVVVCTQEAKQCPDGSYVSRTGPMCEFADCPEISNLIDTTGWKTYTDSSNGITFQYPEVLPTTYIHTQDWPPKIKITSGPLVCNPSGSLITSSGKTSEVTIGANDYCINEQDEGAAGSTYINYTYSAEISNQLITLTFTIREVQCANYDDPNKTDCENERATFDIGSTINQIFETISSTGA